MWNWEYISSEHFQGYYQKQHKLQAVKGLYFLEKYKSKVDSLTNFTNTGAFNLGFHFLEIPKLFTSEHIVQKIPVVFQEMGQANGYANPIKPKISLYANRMRADGFVWGESWYRLVGVHEYTHIAQMSAKEGDVLAAILGGWVSPNIYHPLWLLEGYTVYSESQIAPNEGRLKNGVYSAIAGSQKFFGENPSLLDLTYYDSYKFPASAQYLYGSLLVDFLAKEYGKSSLAQYVTAVDNQGILGILNILFPNFYMDDVAQTVFGEDFTTLYQRALAELPLVNTGTHKELYGVATGNVLEYCVQDGVCYYTVEETNASDVPIAKLYRWEQRQSYLVRSFVFADDYDFQLRGGYLYYRKPKLGSGFANIEELGSGIIKKLYRLDLQSNKEKLVIDEDIQSYVADSCGNVYFTLNKEDSYGSKIYYKKSGAEPVLLLQTDKFISQIDFAGDSFVFTAKEELGSLGLYSWQRGDSLLVKLLNSAWTEANGVFLGEKLIYTANYDGKLAGYSYSFQNRKVQKLTTADFAMDVCVDNGKVYYLGLGKEGFRLCRDTLRRQDFTPPANEKEIQFTYEDFTYTSHGNAALRNLASILVPDIRLSPLLQYGTDLLGSTEYQFSFGEQFTFNAMTMIFDPLILTLYCQNQDNFLLQSYLPVYSAIDFGLSSIYLLGGYEYEQKNESYFTGLELAFAFPYDNFSFTSTYDNQDDIDAEIDYSHYFSTAKIVLSGQVNKLNKEKIAWHEKEKNATLFYQHKIWQIDKGLWSPSLYWRDLSLKFFGEYDQDELTTDSFEQDTKFGAGLVPKVLTLQGNLSSDLEFGVLWEKEKSSDYKPEFYTKFVISF